MICPAGQGPDLFETIEGCPQRPKKEIHEGSPSETVLPHGQACGPASRCAPPLEEQEGWEQSPPGSAGVPPAPVRAQPGPTPPARIKREPGHGSPPAPTEAASAGRVDSRGGGERMRAGRPRSRGASGWPLKNPTGVLPLLRTRFSSCRSCVSMFNVAANRINGIWPLLPIVKRTRCFTRE